VKPTANHTPNQSLKLVRALRSLDSLNRRCFAVLRRFRLPLSSALELHLLQPEGALSITERLQLPEIKKVILQLSAIAMLLAAFAISIKFEKIHRGIENYLLAAIGAFLFVIAGYALAKAISFWKTGEMYAVYPHLFRATILMLAAIFSIRFLLLVRGGSNKSLKDAP
jgi:uncharacterized membrane protein YozB (DUF420 family)